ncbi:hypothetical protein MRX96_037486 [Rhipicephalus microplus]
MAIYRNMPSEVEGGWEILVGVVAGWKKGHVLTQTEGASNDVVTGTSRRFINTTIPRPWHYPILKEAFGRMRVPKFLPPLEGPDRSVTGAHSESATLQEQGSRLRLQTTTEKTGFFAPGEVAKVQINKEKTFCVLFAHGQGGLGMKSRLTIRAENADRALTLKASIRMLGGMFDQRFSFFLHADALMTKVESL